MSLSYPPNNSILIIYFAVRVKDLFETGKEYPWSRPKRCPRCKGIRLWGHGFAGRYFQGFVQRLWVKKYLCPDCKSVHTMRPSTHWRRFQSSRFVILRSLLYKIRRNKWRRSLPRQNQQYWFSGLIFQASRQKNIKLPTVEVIGELLRGSIIPVSHSIHCECLRL
ncbi:MAG: hypothetical protein XU11_C0086G0003 [Candidatus Dadabacteria bacterium CSP1-2]|nr:MAG: hypothetical protein XU11_C0086G0003 [Candidatus Dadabacteria bacterium CSP1-2]